MNENLGKHVSPQLEINMDATSKLRVNLISSAADVKSKASVVIEPKIMKLVYQTAPSFLLYRPNNF
jgi:hypothetical protein